MVKPKRKKVDQEAVERDYRAGMLTNIEIARRHGCVESYVRKLANKYGWERDLSAKVRNKVKTKLVRKKVRVRNGKIEKRTEEEQEQFEKEVIEAAANEGAEIIRTHREIIDQCLEIVTCFLSELKANKDFIVETKDGKKVSVPLQPANRATMLNSATQAISRMIPLQRQAFSLDDDGDEPEVPELPEAEKDDLKRLAAEIAKEEIKNG